MNIGQFQNLSKISRTKRDFLVGAAAMGLSIPIASLLWSQSAMAKQKGGHLRAGLAGANTTDTLDSGSFDDTFMISIGFSIRNNLVEVGSDNLLHPALAQSWEPVGDGSKWIFHLRKGVEFNNGKSFSATDVLSSLNSHRGADSTSGAKGILEAAGLIDLKADDSRTLTFQLSAPNATFPAVLSDYHLNIAPDKDGRPDFEAPIGTGAYVLELFEPGVRALLRLNPNRWNQEVGFVETAELLAVNDTQSRQSALISNSLDAINRLDLKTAARLAQNQNVRVVSVPGRLHVSMPMRVNVEPFSNNDVRTALKLAVNREEWRKKLLFGHAELGNDHPIGSAYPYHASDIPQREYDPDKAKFLLKRAGYSSIKISLSAADAGWLGAVDAATIYKENAAKAGIDIDIVRESNDDYWNSVWNHKAFIVMYWGPRASEDMILSANYVSEAPLNDNGWKSERLDKLLFAARAELDETKRRELYREIQLLIRDDGATIIPLFPEMVQAVSAKVGIDKNISGNWEMDGGKFVERWWLTA